MHRRYKYKVGDVVSVRVLGDYTYGVILERSRIRTEWTYENEYGMIIQKSYMINGSSTHKIYIYEEEIISVIYRKDDEV